MADYWLDSNVFIEGRKGPYGFDIAPRFWSLLDELTSNGRVSSPAFVYSELTNAQYDLVAWAHRRRASALFVQPDTVVQIFYRHIVGFVTQYYNNNKSSSNFVAKADPWVIAHAAAKVGTVVTLEVRVPTHSKKVKIPNVCDQYNVRCINTYQMLRELGVSWNT